MGGGGMDYYDPSMLLALSSQIPPPPPEQVEKLKAELAEAKKAWDAIRGTPEGLAKGADGQPKQRPFRLKYEKLQADFNALSDPAARGYAVHGVRDAKTLGDTELRIRGEAEKLGPAVPRGFLTAFTVPGAAPVNPRQSGRLELAHWLANPKNPLTPRVMVNRIWQHLFGQGIVTTVDNFGAMGDRPSHPALLDYLANRFMREGWSIKKLVRTLVLTRAYQLASLTDSNPKSEIRNPKSTDPSNRLLWRHSPRRLDAEEMRDAMLATAGNLKLARPAGSPAQALKMMEMRDNGPEAGNIHDKSDRSQCRSVYLPLLRGVTPHSLEAFDPVEQTLVTGSRDTTTVPGQALYLLNSSFVRRQALAMAERLLKNDTGEKERIALAYQLTFSRLPTAKEAQRAKTFLAEYESAYHELPAVAQAKPKPINSAKPATVPANPDEIDQTGEPISEEVVRPKDATTAAWLAFVQALYGAAEFRYLP
jgi:hypothetical protein